MDRKFELKLKTFKNKLTKSLRDFLFEKKIFSIKKVDLLDVKFTDLDESNNLVSIEESKNTNQIDVLVVDVEKFKNIINTVSKKSKNSDIEKISNKFNKINQKLLESISQHFFCVFERHQYTSIHPDEENGNNKTTLLGEKDRFFYYLLAGLLESFSLRKRFKNNKYLYIFSETESIEEVISNHFNTIIHINKINLYNYKKIPEYKIAISLYLRSWSEVIKHRSKNDKKNNSKYIGKLHSLYINDHSTVNFISSQLEIEKLYCFRNYYFVYKRRNLHKFSSASTIDIYLNSSDKQILVEIIFKYLNKGKEYLNKEDFEIISPRINGDEAIYFTKNKDTSHIYSNYGRFTLQFSTGYLLF